MTTLRVPYVAVTYARSGSSARAKYRVACQ
jgi:hypothetical protein